MTLIRCSLKFFTEKGKLLGERDKRIMYGYNFSDFLGSNKFHDVTVGCR